MKPLLLLLTLAVANATQVSSAFAATYRGTNIDGKKYAASTRINGVIVPISVQFGGKYVSVWIDGEIIEMKLEVEDIKDPSAVGAHDGKKEWLLNVLGLDC